MRMKAGRVIRRMLMVSAFLLAAAAVSGENSSIMLNVGPVLTWSYADLSEYVYLTPLHKKLSQLDWDAYNVIQYGAKAEFTHNRFILSCEFAVAMEDECGLMQDYDWFYIYVDNPQYPDDTFTEFSEHQVTALEKNRFDIKAGWKIIKKPEFEFGAGFGFQYLKTYLHGHDGYLQHSCYENRNIVGYTNQNVSPYDPDRPKLCISGNAISYQQKIESVWLDVRSDFIFSPSYTLSVEAGISPWQKIGCDDYHFKSETTYVWYYDSPQSSVMFRGSVSGYLSFAKRSSLVLSLSVLSLPFAEGNNYVNGNSAPSFDNRAGKYVLGGTGYLGWDISFSYRIRIF